MVIRDEAIKDEVTKEEKRLQNNIISYQRREEVIIREENGQ